jgi:ribulose-phosphate 3-epimerase
VLPSILSADFARLGEEVADVIAAGADGIHVDIMDGHFVPNLTMGPALVKSLRGRFGRVYFDVHLMVEKPADFVEPFAEAGADCLTFHIEATAGRDEHDEHALIEQIRSAGCEVGIVVNPPTPVESIAHLIDQVDMVLIMSVNPGFSGQSFMPEVLDKARFVAERKPGHVRLEMDGGINVQTVEQVRQAGVDTIVAASAVFGAQDRKATIDKLRGEARP